MTHATLQDTTQHKAQQNSTTHPASSKAALSVVKAITQSKVQDQRVKIKVSTHPCITIRRWLPAACGGRRGRTTRTTLVDLACGGLRATSGASVGVRGWLGC